MQPSSPTVEQAPAGRGQEKRPPPALVVVVDSDAAWRREVARALRHAGYTVVEATSALEGLAKASSVPAPVIATNYPMLLPGGSPLARVLSSCPELSGAIIIAAVSDGRPENVAAARADGCRAVIVRPAPASTVLEAVTRALAGGG